jgi:predicted DNA-binding transcriptional regulator AlpA
MVDESLQGRWIMEAAPLLVRLPGVIKMTGLGRSTIYSKRPANDTLAASIAVC